MTSGTLTRAVPAVYLAGLQTHLAFFSLLEGEVGLTQLLAPAAPRQGVEDNGVVVATVVETGVEVHCDVFCVVADVDGEAEIEAWK